MRASHTRRAGYTLAEILVVLGLMLLLAALAAGVGYSGLIGSQKVVSGADRASGWLLIAKQQAKRAGVPNGVRFIGTPDASGAVYFREAQYIAAPDPWVPNPDKRPTGPRLAFSYEYQFTGPQNDNEPNQAVSYIKTVYFVTDDLTGSDIAEFGARVEPGDMLVIPQFGESYYVESFAAPASNLSVEGRTFPAAQCRQITLRAPLLTFPDITSGGTPLVTPVPATGKLTAFTTLDFGFQGKARPLIAEPVLQMTNEIAIDYRPPGATGYKDLFSPASPTPPYNPQTTFGVAPMLVAAGPTTGQPVYDAEGKCTFDVLFSPSGQVLGNASSVICLWIRKPENVPHPRLNQADATLTANCDRTDEYNAAGDQVLVVVSTRSGLIATQPINPPPGGVAVDPYKFAKDGQNNGL